MASALLLWGLYRVVSTYFFIFMAAICLSEALWRPKMALKGALDLFTGKTWSPRAFVFTHRGTACFALALAFVIRRFSPWAGVWLLALVGIVLAVDTRVSIVFRLHRCLLTDDDLVALMCLMGLFLVCVMGIAFPFVGIANESAELAQHIGRYSEYMPEFDMSEVVKNFGLDGMIRDMGKDYENVTWYSMVNRSVHSVVEGDFDLAAEWRGWRGNRTLLEVVTHYGGELYREAQGMEAMPTKETAAQGAKVLSATISTLFAGLLGTGSIVLSFATSLTDRAIRVCYFLSLLLYFLGRRRSVLQVLLEMLGDESELRNEVQDILSGVFKYPAARMVTRFWSTCLLAYAFNVQFLWILSATTMVMSFAPIALGSYPYLVAVPWWLCGRVRGGAALVWLFRVIGSLLLAITPAWIANRWSSTFASLMFGVGGSPEEFWLGATFLVCLFIVHTCILDSVELSMFSVSKHVPPYAIGLTVLLGFEHFGVWALFYCPMLLCAATLGYRICFKGEFLHGAASEDGKDGDVGSAGGEDTDSDACGVGAPTVTQIHEPEAFLQLTRKMVKRVSVAAQKVHERADSSMDDGDGDYSLSKKLARDRHRRRATAPAQRTQGGRPQMSFAETSTTGSD